MTIPIILYLRYLTDAMHVQYLLVAIEVGEDCAMLQICHTLPNHTNLQEGYNLNNFHCGPSLQVDV